MAPVWVTASHDKLPWRTTWRFKENLQNLSDKTLLSGGVNDKVNLPSTPQQGRIPQVDKASSTAVWLLLLARLTVQSTAYIKKESITLIFGVGKPNKIRNHEVKPVLVECIGRIQMLTFFLLHVPWKLTDSPVIMYLGITCAAEGSDVGTGDEKPF